MEATPKTPRAELLRADGKWRGTGEEFSNPRIWQPYYPYNKPLHPPQNLHHPKISTQRASQHLLPVTTYLSRYSKYGYLTLDYISSLTVPLSLLISNHLPHLRITFKKKGP
jgi:hypothetical protein